MSLKSSQIGFGWNKAKWLGLEIFVSLLFFDIIVNIKMGKQ
jgi:hypothetical protein